MSKFKARVAAAYLIILAAFACAYLKYGWQIKFFAYSQLEKASRQNIKTSDIIFLNDKLSFTDYADIIEKIRQSDNSIVLLMPQIFYERCESFLDDMSPDDLRAQKEAYKQLTLKLIESQNVIPLVYLANGGQGTQTKDIESFGYFEGKDTGLDLSKYAYDSANAKDARIFMTMQNLAFYNDGEKYAYKMPLLYMYRNAVLVNPAVEAIRKYYRFPKTQIKIEKGNLRIGSIITVPLTKNGEIMIHRLFDSSGIYGLKQFLALPKDSLSDKIILVNDNKEKTDAMLGLGVAVQSILKQQYIKYSESMNYIIAALCLVIFYLLYRNLTPALGTAVLILTGAAGIIAALQLLANNYYLDVTQVSAANAAAFFTAYFFKVIDESNRMRQRKETFAKYMSKNALSSFIQKNRDVKIKNTWTRAYTAYIMFDPVFAQDPQNIKKVFEKTKEIIYNNFKDALIKIAGSGELDVIFFAENTELKALLETLFEIKNANSEYNFNILLNDTEVYTYEVNREIMVTDKNFSMKEEIGNMERKKYLMVPEKDLQGYINSTKFQKITEPGFKSVFFNITGTR